MNKRDRAIVAIRNYLDDGIDCHRPRVPHKFHQGARNVLSPLGNYFVLRLDTHVSYLCARTHLPCALECSRANIRSLPYERHLTQSTRAVQCKALKRYVIEFDKRPDTAPVQATISRTPAEYQGERSLETFRINRAFCQTMNNFDFAD